MSIADCSAERRAARPGCLVPLRCWQLAHSARLQDVSPAHLSEAVGSLTSPRFFSRGRKRGWDAVFGRTGERVAQRGSFKM